MKESGGRESRNLLVAGADGLTRDELTGRLEGAGYRVERASTGAEALRLLGTGTVDLLITEWDLPDLGGGGLARRLRGRGAGIPVLVYGSRIPPERRREMSRAGVEDYLELPVEWPHVLSRVAAALERRDAPDEELLLGTSEAIREVVATIAQIAPHKVSVLVTGESGTGKELVARSIHGRSPRRDGPFIAVNCGALPPGVLESELFGHEKGAFTGATAERKGRFELADGGTLFLDEVGELPAATQVELLRVLEGESFVRVGGTREVHVDVRIVAATNRELERAVREGIFRQDLYHRLRVVSVKLPPLRDRPEDIPLLAEHFLREAAERHGLEAPRMSAAAMQRLERRSWPGNVRELRNLMDSLVILAHGREVTLKDLPPDAEETAGTANLPVHVRVTREEAEKELLYQSLVALRAEISEIKHLMLKLSSADGAGGPGPAWAPPRDEKRVASPPLSMAETEEEAVRNALLYTGGNRREAARLLNIGLRTLYRKIRLYGIA